jgi:hypothetical protein
MTPYMVGPRSYYSWGDQRRFRAPVSRDLQNESDCLWGPCCGVLALMGGCCDLCESEGQDGKHTREACKLF